MGMKEQAIATNFIHVRKVAGTVTMKQHTLP
jgi:hypothetical protein